MTQKEYKELQERAKAMSVEQQRVIARCFDAGILLRALVDRVAFLEEYYNKQVSLTKEYSDETYLEEPLERMTEHTNKVATVDASREDQVKKTKEKIVEATNG